MPADEQTEHKLGTQLKLQRVDMNNRALQATPLELEAPGDLGINIVCDGLTTAERRSYSASETDVP